MIDIGKARRVRQLAGHAADQRFEALAVGAGGSVETLADAVTEIQQRLREGGEPETDPTEALMAAYVLGFEVGRRVGRGWQG